jgi:hypothetical protein
VVWFTGFLLLQAFALAGLECLQQGIVPNQVLLENRGVIEQRPLSPEAGSAQDGKC